MPADNNLVPDVSGVVNKGSDFNIDLPDINLENLNVSDIGSALRSLDLRSKADPPQYDVEPTDTNKDNDWRVSLTVPEWASNQAKKGVTVVKNTNDPDAESEYIWHPLSPLQRTGNKLIFPYTPNISLTNSSSYTPIKPIHSNYPFFAYQNSSVDAIQILADVLVQNVVEAEYWIAMVHYFRFVTKMSYGQDSTNQGSPPPIVKLNGYGDFVFNNVPVIVTNFSMDLSQDVDYITASAFNYTRVPTKSTFSVQLQPIYSRRSVEAFSLDKFISGEYLNRGFL